MNKRSLRETLPGNRRVKVAFLKGFRRIFDAPVHGYLSLNIIPRRRFIVKGVLIRISPSDLILLKRREVGYVCKDITSMITPEANGRVYAFIAPHKQYPALKIPKSYMDICLGGVPKQKRALWIRETIIENDIVDDTRQPVYQDIK